MSESLPIRADPAPNEGTESGFFEDTLPTIVGTIIGIIICIIPAIIVTAVLISLLVPLTVLFFYLLTIFGLATSVLLLICLLVTRIFQLIRSHDEYQTLCFYKNLIRTWLYLIPLVSLWGLWLFYPIIKYTPALKQVTLAEVPLAKWIEVISIMCGLSSFSFLPYISVLHIFTGFVKNGSTSNVGQSIVEIFDSLIFWWATNVLIKHVPSIKHHQILGLPTLNWIWVSVVILISYNILVLFTHLIVLLLQLIVCLPASKGGKNSWKSFFRKHFHVKYAVYIANGMKASTCFVLISLSLLLTWNLYFESHLDLKSPSVKRIWEYGRRTFICLLTFSILWLIKTLVLLLWDAHTVYGRLQRQILSTSEQLYFLGILGSLKHNFFKLQLHPEDNEGTEKDFIDLLFSSVRSFYVEMLSRALTTLNLSQMIDFHTPLQILLPPSQNNRNFFTQKYSIFLSKCYTRLGIKRVKYFNLLCKVRETIQDDLFWEHPEDSTLDDIYRASQYFFQARQSLAEETYIDDIMQNFSSDDDGTISLNWEKLILGKKVNNNDEMDIINVQSGQLQVRAAQNSNQNATGRSGEIEEEPPVAESSRGGNNNTTSDVGDWEKDLSRFRENLQAIKEENSQVGKTKQENLNPDFPYSTRDIRTWVERAHKQCVNMVNTLSSAKELADCLNKIISWLIIGAIFIIWLLLTELATTKVLVLIASPLLAASFIFGETCKTLFQGIIYVYVVHPLYVGELCVVDNKMLEVKTVGVWKTTFTKVGTSVEVIYPNTDLKNKFIVKYKTEYDWDFNVELCVSSRNDKEINELKEDIEKYLIEHCYKNCTVEVMTIAYSGTKIAISFHHNAKGENSMMTYDVCQKLKHKILSGFILDVRKHIRMDESKIKAINIQGTKESEGEITSDTGKE